MERTSFFVKIIFILTIILNPKISFARLNFDPAMISDNVNNVADLSVFSTPGRQLPGNYNVDVYLNGSFIEKKNIYFTSIHYMNIKTKSVRDDTGLMACLRPDFFQSIGLNFNTFTKINNTSRTKCFNPGEYIDSAYTRFSFSKMRLDINIPQAYLILKNNESTNETEWDNGINAVFLSWQYSGNKNSTVYGNAFNDYMNLNSGINTGAWRLRDNSILTRYRSNGKREHSWEHLNTYLMRPIVPWKSNLVIGNTQSNGNIFESFSFSGFKIGTDLAMYSDTMQGFAPVIRGVAASNAEVYVRQNGNLIYSTAVPAGAFSITDLASVSNSGDLRVTIVETNGTKTHFVVPYSSVPVLQREGRVVYTLAAGKVRDTNNLYDPLNFAHGTFQWGVTDDTTIYGGTQLANRYQAAAIGTGLNAGLLGAISADVTRAESLLADESKHSGASWRLMYARSLSSVGTTFQLMANRFSTRGYYTLSEAALKKMNGWASDDLSNRINPNNDKVNWGDYYNLYQAKKNLIQANITQRLGEVGSLYLTASRQTYWSGMTPTTSFQVGFNSSFWKVNYQVSAGYSKYSDQPYADKSIYLSFSLPLDNWLSNRGMLSNSYLAYNINSGNGSTSNQMQLSGSALENNNLNWGVSQVYNQREGNSSDAAIDYLGTYGGISLGYGQSKNYSQLRYGATGSVVLSSYGLTFGQQLSKTNILIKAPEASYIPVTDSPGVRTDWRGYTIKNNASDYRRNRVALNVGSLDQFTEIKEPVKYVTPTEGAIVLAGFNVRKGHQALLNLIYQDKPLPFGAGVSVSDDDKAGIIDENGEVYLTGLKEKGLLRAKWGNHTGEQCTARYDFSKIKQDKSIIQMSLVCK
ncbi:fimbria/pilus outer membrane usher protein [Pantoea stewartii]|uniref:fimbria/pilus outer membrane usher protein n=1 Tax=Pantoea stewartii TaxID=66269 RepID=UPI001981238C|nr:fimbria/pilus outer membrane usher protein [Pantoea stewartii]